MSKLKLLIVDDEPGIRSGVERVLRNFTVGYPFMEEDFSFEILEAETGEKAIEIIDSINYQASMVLKFWNTSNPKNTISQ
jgi:YesN/AraC family two-component response regulator